MDEDGPRGDHAIWRATTTGDPGLLPGERREWRTPRPDTRKPITVTLKRAAWGPSFAGYIGGAAPNLALGSVVVTP